MVLIKLPCYKCHCNKIAILALCHSLFYVSILTMYGCPYVGAMVAMIEHPSLQETPVCKIVPKRQNK